MIGRKFSNAILEIDLIIFYDGIHSYISAIQNGHRIYLQTLSNMPANTKPTYYQRKAARSFPEHYQIV